MSGRFARSLLRQLGDEAVGVIDLGQAFAQDTDADRYGAVDRAVIAVVASERFDVAVEQEPDDLRVLVDDWRPGIAANGVVAGDEIERLLRVQGRLRRDPARRQRERIGA